MIALENHSGIFAEKDRIQSRRDQFKIFSGSANIELSEEISQYLKVDLSSIKRKRFADGEIYIQLQESIRGFDIFLVQATCNPVNDSLLELLIMIDACRRASARQITAVMPYYGYARADRKVSGRESITAKLVSNLIVQAGADRVLALDLHSPQIQAYFDIPIDHISGFPVFVKYFSEKNLSDAVVVSPDIGGVSRARAFAKALGGVPLAIIDKRRPEHNVSQVMNVIGDVRGKTAILVDDIIDTGGTLAAAAQALKDAGAATVLACASHAVFSPPAFQNLGSGVFDEVIITNTVPVPQKNRFEQLKILSVADVLGEAIWRIHKGLSVSSMFSI